jgi:hypothetical protein
MENLPMGRRNAITGVLVDAPCSGTGITAENPISNGSGIRMISAVWLRYSRKYYIMPVVLS